MEKKPSSSFKKIQILHDYGKWCVWNNSNMCTVLHLLSFFRFHHQPPEIMFFFQVSELISLI